ncbi:btaf1 RNA polymerase II, B-TFIID transcription factor-associated, 170kDa [Ancistrocladus abbreviatus]
MAPQQQPTSSRLSRLLTLLDTGSTQATRFAAARQIGDIAKSHPQDLTSLLKKVSQYLRSRNWDTRVAAAQAIGAIAEKSKQTSLDELSVSVEKKIYEAGISCSVEDVTTLLRPKTAASLSFRSFDMSKVLEFGTLLASGGQEYDIVHDNMKNPKERLARQKHNLRRRLGLDVCEQFMDLNDVIKDEDLAHKVDSQGGRVNRFWTPHSERNIQQLVANMVPSFRSKRPSARELNLLKRKAKVNSKGWSDEQEKDAPSPQNTTVQTISSAPSLSTSKVVPDSATDDESIEHDGDGRWPFHSFVEQLLVDMFDPVWEVRHGSIMALREILTHQGAYAGVYVPKLSSCNEASDNIIDTVNLPMKREAENDLNVQVIEDDSGCSLKRQRFEDGASSLNLGENVSQTADDRDNVSVGSGNMKSESYVNDAKRVPEEALIVAESMMFCEGSRSLAGEMDVAKRLTGNSELMQLVTLTQHSWLRNCEILQDCAIRFLCVLSLDRFGDYVSDQVVAPVRETCAQALGAVLKYMAPELVRETLNILLQMRSRPEWEIRHGSLLGIKYLVAIRQEMLMDLLGFVLPSCKAGLEDPDDDVRAVAADALIPAASAIVSQKGQTLHSIVMLLWDILLDLDDLSPSTSSVMNLLAEIYSHEEMILNMHDVLTLKEKQVLDLNEVSFHDDCHDGGMFNPYMLSGLAPRLWPFMRHSITSVRYSAIRTLERLLEAGYRRHSSEPSANSFWPSFILGDTLRIVFQNLLLESNDDILQCTERVWRLLLQCPVRDLEVAAASFISSWLELVTTPYGSALDTSKMYWPVAPPRKSQFKAAVKMRAVRLENEAVKSIGLDASKETIPVDNNGDISSSSVKIVVGADMDKSVTHTRVAAATALGVFSSKWPLESLHCISDPLWKNLVSSSGVQRQVASLVLISWFREIKEELSEVCGVHPPFADQFKRQLLDLLSCADPSLPMKDSALPYVELSRTYSKMRGEARLFFNAIESLGLFKEILAATSVNLENLGVDDAIDFASKVVLPSDSTGEMPTGTDVLDDLRSLKQQLLTTSRYLKCVQSNLHITVSALMAAAVVWMSDLPSKLNPIILPLMASVRREQEEILQDKAADALAELICHCVMRKPGPVEKLIKNLCSLTCMDPCETPEAATINSMETIEEHGLLSFRSTTLTQKSRTRLLGGSEDRSRVEGFISRRGAELALKHLCSKFGASLFEKIPKIWDCLTEVLKPINPEMPIPAQEEKVTLAIELIKDPQILINNVQVVRSIAPLVDDTLKPKLLTLLPCIFKCVRHSHVAVRLAASRCITSMAKSMTTSVMGVVVENAVPMLGDGSSVPARHGAGMLISLLVRGLGSELVPYAPVLVVPLLRCMSDCDSSVRQSVTQSFAALVPLLPLARGLPPPVGLSGSLLRDKEDAQFLEQLLDNSSIEDYKLSTELKVTLRRYQQEGINWLAFLRRFKLHGILCDDMGLGKTLQASAIVASDIAEYRLENCSEEQPPSLIICPSTLVGHWAYEIEKYIDPSLISTLQYVGSAPERISLRSCFDKYNVIITSYDVVRKDIDYLGQLNWNYCILDEGHIIKNARSKITSAVKQLKTHHRLILSGTPIQNNILDLWSLFDFLMPGFLGTERQFQATYGKPLLAARDSKCSAKDAEAGILAMEALHKQVMPFLLRRTKDEVLSDLPEKIIQDRYCDLSPVQLKLYEQFSGSHVRKEISSMVKIDDSVEKGEGNGSVKASSHVFQALQYLLKLCSHPLLVIGEEISSSVKEILSDLFATNPDVISELHKLHHSPKLVALQEILEECGIGVDASNSEGMLNIGQHRVLIFAQHKALLDIIERDLFHQHMKNVTYLRLDGSVEPEKRFEIVKAFNSDPTIDALLLTTHVGGLGLNLTSADTIIFMEHDWNPMRDLQAMDRAHRLGQRKVVNVHRLIMRGTLEEKVMSLQRFKVSVANAVINAENASLKTMNTDQLLDLFTSAESHRKGVAVSKGSDGSSIEKQKATGSGKGLKAILNGLEELWDQSQYTEEYNLSQFLAKLNG